MSGNILIKKLSPIPLLKLFRKFICFAINGDSFSKVFCLNRILCHSFDSFWSYVINFDSFWSDVIFSHPEETRILAICRVVHITQVLAAGTVANTLWQLFH